MTATRWHTIPPVTAFDSELGQFVSLMAQLQAQPGLGSRALGVPEWDWRLWRMGREHLARRAPSPEAEPPPAILTSPVRDVYLATQIYDVGGHTALIGDFVRALGNASAHLIVTDLFGQNSSPVPEVVVSRLGLPASQVSVLPGPSHGDRLRQLFVHLQALRPARLFLFHHPQDPLASVVAQPEIARQRVLVHHADATPSFGLHVPGIVTIDLHPTAVAMARALGRDSSLLPLTSPDPGPRPHGFLRRGHLVSASSGSAHKFGGAYAMSYAETVGVILRATAGRHVHIGPLGDEALDDIGRVLAREGVPADRFAYVRTARSIAAALWDHDVDVYCASFPIDGARTRIEVLAAGTPYLRHVARPVPGSPADPTRDADGLLAWCTWDDLTTTLLRLSSDGALCEHSTHARRLYERHHHPDMFARTLTRILDGRPEPSEVMPARMEAAMQSLASALIAGRVPDASVQHILHSIQAALADTRSALASDSERLDAVQCRHDEWMRRLEAEMLRLEEGFAAERLDQRERAARLETERAHLGRILADGLVDRDRRIATLEAELSGLKEARTLTYQELQQQLDRLRAEQDALRSGSGLRAALRRWLMPS